MHHGLATQVDVGLNEGLRHDSSGYGDQLVSLQKSQLTQFVGSLDATKLKCLDDALMVAPPQLERPGSLGRSEMRPNLVGLISSDRLHPVPSFDSGKVLDLVTATESAGDHPGLGSGLANGGEEPPFADLA